MREDKQTSLENSLPSVYRTVTLNYMEFIIRNVRKDDYDAAERITRDAFYNLYVPGCVEHYLIHTMHSHPDFIPELSFIAELDGEMIGSIMYTRARIVDDDGNELQVATFGPVSIAPVHQRKGYGKKLIEHSLHEAESRGYGAVIIFGNPSNYVSSGFVSSKRFKVSDSDGRYPAAMMVKCLSPGLFKERHWTYYSSPAMDISYEDAMRYDDSLEKKPRVKDPCQESFYIISNSYLDPDI